MNEKRHRSLLKAISWRITGTLDTVVICWVITGTFKIAMSIGFVEMFTKVLIYYIHERVWDKIKLGREISKIT